MAGKYNTINELPVEVLQEIFMRLSSEDLGKVRRCCKTWRNLASTEYFCKIKLNFNWRNVIFNGRIVHLPNIIRSLVYLDEKILIVAVEPHTIVIINISNGTIEKSLFADAFDYVEKKGDKLYAHGTSGRNFALRLQVWNLQSYEVIFNLQTNLTGYCWVESIYYHLIACVTVEVDVNNRVLHIFNIKTGKLDYRREGITDVHCYNDIIAIGVKGGIIEIMDLSYNPVMTLNCCNNNDHFKIEIKNDYLVTVSFECAAKSARLKGVCVWNLKTKVKLFTIEQAKFTWLGFLNENILICEKHKSLLLVDVLTGKSIGEITGVRLNNIVSNNRFLFVESMETQCVELWCPRTQKLINSFGIEKPNCRVIGIEQFWNLYRLASKTHFAYFTTSDIYTVHIMDFGP